MQYYVKFNDIRYFKHNENDIGEKNNTGKSKTKFLVRSTFYLSLIFPFWGYFHAKTQFPNARFIHPNKTAIYYANSSLKGI